MTTAAQRIKQRRKAREHAGWPFCEHDGTERLYGTAADHFAGLQKLPRDEFTLSMLAGIEKIAALCGPEDLIGVCPTCLCITYQDAPPHRSQEGVQGPVGRP